jgi:hypothetical protein
MPVQFYSELYEMSGFIFMAALMPLKTSKLIP